MPYGNQMMGWMWIWWIVGLAVVLLLARVVIAPFGGRTPDTESPETILKRRYARGEINRDEYLRQLEELRK